MFAHFCKLYLGGLSILFIRLSLMQDNFYLFNKTEKKTDTITQNEIQPESKQDTVKDKLMAVMDAGLVRDGYVVIPDQVIVIAPEIIPVLQLKPTYDFNGKTVLAVDDVSFNLDLITLFFRKTGAKMLFAANGQEALDACIANPQIDIVLMDIQMPVMNGLDATREIRKINPGIPVIAITAFVHAEDKQRCFDAGCNNFLSKPCSRADMLMAVNKYLQGSLTGHAGS